MTLSKRHFGSLKHMLAIALSQRAACVVRAELSVPSVACSAGLNSLYTTGKSFIRADHVSDDLEECSNVPVDDKERRKKYEY